MKYIALTMIFALAAPALTARALAETPTPDLQILFQDEATSLPAGSHAALNRLLERIKNGKIPLITVNAFAAVADQPSWAAQRLALTRALAVRDYLVQNAIPPKRIILKPLGNLCAAPCQRVDIFLKK